MAENTTLLKIENLKKYFPIKGGFFVQKTLAHLKAVDGISFEVGHRKTFGLVGESGCGKSTAGRALLRLHEPTDGKIIINGEDVTTIKEKHFKPYRKSMQIVFQDPTSSLNPKMTVGQTLMEPLLFHGICKSKAEAIEKVKELLVLVGLKAYHLDRYSHQFSGGQRQRIAIARAITVNPSILILDEPTSALDVSVQAQIINLLNKIQEELDAGYIFISHDLSVVRFISDEVGIMYLGRIIEKGSSDEIFDNPLHPYSKALLAASPIPDPRKRRDRKDLIGGQVPSPINRPTGCFFKTRCKYKMDICDREYPSFDKVSSEHFVACHLFDK